MSNAATIYIAGVGMLTPIGASAVMTTASVKAGISAQQLSHHESRQGDPITMTQIPQPLFEELTVKIEPGTYYREQYDRIIKMAIYAMRDALDNVAVDSPIPLILSMPEPASQPKPMSARLLAEQLLAVGQFPIDAKHIRCFYTGRAAAIHGVMQAYHYLEQSAYDYVLIGGSDSYHTSSQLAQLDKDDRLLTSTNKNGFAPGEGAGFLLLTRHRDKALCQNGHIIAIHPPGIGEEEGHLYSPRPYLGNGLDAAFKQALAGYRGAPISTVYSSMNGEHFWTKEYGVALTRNASYFSDKLVIEHPADCYGDLGAATGSVLVGLSALALLQEKTPSSQLVYSSSDRETRAAVCLERVPL